jgi:glycosyltransferase involved in cell wall biosynthesis
MGEQPIEEVNRQLAMGHIFVNTSRSEGFPNTFIQAWMRKVPTVSLDIDPDGVLSSDAIGYCSRTYGSLRDKVTELADNNELRQRMGAAAQKHAYTVHSPEAVERIIRIMDESEHE